MQGCAKISESHDNVDYCSHATENLSTNPDGVPVKSDEGSSSMRSGGIFKFLGGPRPGDVEVQPYLVLSTAMVRLRRALFAFPVHSAETSTILKKRDSYEGGLADESSNRTVLEISASDAFREALSTYESLGEHRKQEAAFGHFQLACYQRDLCLRFLDLVDKEIKQKNEEKYRQKTAYLLDLNSVPVLSGISNRAFLIVPFASAPYVECLKPHSLTCWKVAMWWKLMKSIPPTSTWR
ncbi:hypothetical protein PR202_ga08893 [Eleusine coracana subsp. coracana]|uniref:Uncharacterized protein n=1 Tax=Eleusine coracana subsp. coracana TaxID=191504 RepID=A0AAV5C2U4_ELECO|nr:hypothetical protein PR202_ga08893 [Eleusine coracana subsp. coracana]